MKLPLLVVMTWIFTVNGTALAAPPDAPSEAPTTKPAEVERFQTNRTDAKPLTAPVEKDMFSFVIFGDRTGGPIDGVDVLAEAVHDTNLIDPDLVMTVGDLVQGYDENPLWDKQADEFSGIMDKLNCPWYPVAGNHDVTWRDTNKDGKPRPEGGNERNFEKHFGPLWYAIEHKNCWFIVLFSDEGNPVTGEKTFHDPAAQRMSDEQFNWLKETLAKAKGADHVFVFLHHPRWHGLTGINPDYGKDWEKVHEALVEAGNVSAVFAGHIHYMRYDGKVDGIEYMTLATVGAWQSGDVPRAGFLHQYDLVTVRKNHFAITAIPVGAAIDPRSLTDEVLTSARTLAKLRPTIETEFSLADDASAEGSFKVTLTNPTDYPIDLTLTPGSRDSNWFFDPDHSHAHLPPGEALTTHFGVRRLASPVDLAFDLPMLGLDMDLLTKTSRIPIPPRNDLVPTDLSAVRDSDAPDRALKVDGSDESYVEVQSAEVPIPDGPMTVEGWMKADKFGDRVGLMTKAQNSDYGLFVSNGRPAFSIFLGDAYVTVRGKPHSLKPGQWQHVAGVYDGKEVRLYVDGELVNSKPGSGSRRTNNLPLMIGADVGNRGEAMSPFDGEIDDVRISKVARYTGDEFEPATSFESDDQTVLLLSFDEQIGRLLLDDSPQHLQLQPAGTATIAAP